MRSSLLPARQLALFNFLSLPSSVSILFCSLFPSVTLLLPPLFDNTVSSFFLLQSVSFAPGRRVERRQSSGKFSSLSPNTASPSLPIPARCLLLIVAEGGREKLVASLLVGSPASPPSPEAVCEEKKSPTFSDPDWMAAPAQEMSKPPSLKVAPGFSGSFCEEEEEHRLSCPAFIKNLFPSPFLSPSSSTSPFPQREKRRRMRKRENDSHVTEKKREKKHCSPPPFSVAGHGSTKSKEGSFSPFYSGFILARPFHLPL